ncbi:MAG: hypothetical protein N2589_03590 [bacterium]|nr:hypothetical protein [bacterium]
MKRLITILTCLMFILSCGLVFSANEKPKTSTQPATPANPATPAKSATPAEPAKPEVKIQKVVGEITNIDTTANTIKIKKEDGSEITLKATTSKMQEEIKKLQAGKKVFALYKETKAGELVLVKISEEKPKEEKVKKEEKPKTEKK